MAVHVFQPNLGHIGYALGGLLVSPGRGLLWYAPVALVAFFGVWRSRDRLERTIAVALAAQIALACVFFKWFGGYAYGPRLLAEGVWLSIWLAAVRFEAASRLWRRFLAVAIAVTVVVGVLGLWQFRGEQWERRRNADIDENALWDFVDSPISSLFRDISDQVTGLDSDFVRSYRCVDGMVETIP
jgi:hypothetical protein